MITTARNFIMKSVAIVLTGIVAIWLISFGIASAFAYFMVG